MVEVQKITLTATGFDNVDIRQQPGGWCKIQFLDFGKKLRLKLKDMSPMTKNKLIYKYGFYIASSDTPENRIEDRVFYVCGDAAHCDKDIINIKVRDFLILIKILKEWALLSFKEDRINIFETKKSLEIIVRGVEDGFIG